MFFTLSTTKKSKARQTKNGRGSKASRLSTQSNFTAVSEGMSIAETDVNIDNSMLPTAEPAKPTKIGKGGKKASKNKKPTAQPKAKADEAKEADLQVASSFVEAEDDDFEVKIEKFSEKIPGNRKRKSDEISGIEKAASFPDLETQPQPPSAKRRATRTKGSIAQPQDVAVPALQETRDASDIHMKDTETMPPPIAPAPKKKGKGGKKKSASAARKASTTSTASKASLRATLPDDGVIDAMLEADLNRPLTDDEADAEDIEIKQPKSRRLTRTKPESKNDVASIAPMRRTTRASTLTVDAPGKYLYPSIPSGADEEEAPSVAQVMDVSVQEETSGPKAKAKTGKRNISRRGPTLQDNQGEQSAIIQNESILVEKPVYHDDAAGLKPRKAGSRQPSGQLPARSTHTPTVPISQDSIDSGTNLNSSVLGIQTAADDSGHETDASVAPQGRSKRAGKKAPVGKRAKAGKKAPLVGRNVEDIVRPAPNEVDRERERDQYEVDADVVHHVGNPGPEPMETETPKGQPRVTKTAAQFAQGKTATPKSKATPPESTIAFSPHPPKNTIDITDAKASPQPPSVLSTPRPAPSPQSSDAENQPPSSRPSILRPPLSLQSPSKSQNTRIPLAATTPTTSPSRGNFSKLQSSCPWTTVDIEHVFNGTPTVEKENDPFAVGHVVEAKQGALTSPEKRLNVEQWIQFKAQRGEERLRSEFERLVGKFEGEGVRALRTLEGIVCSE